MQTPSLASGVYPIPENHDIHWKSWLRLGSKQPTEDILHSRFDKEWSFGWNPVKRRIRNLRTCENKKGLTMMRPSILRSFCSNNQIWILDFCTNKGRHKALLREESFDESRRVDKEPESKKDREHRTTWGLDKSNWYLNLKIERGTSYIRVSCDQTHYENDLSLKQIK